MKLKLKEGWFTSPYPGPFIADWVHGPDGKNRQIILFSGLVPHRVAMAGDEYGCGKGRYFDTLEEAHAQILAFNAESPWEEEQ